ncbi:MAG: protein kinase [Planctomycetes bacterium]|nr:protein kinase [Planctomycetota bacterium]
MDALAAMAQASGKKPAAAPAPAAPAAAPATPKPAARARRDDKTDPLVGTQLNGFKIISRIGSGGFGVVYRAFDTNLERSVALKMLPPKIAKAGEGLLDRFLREARSAAKLAHANIVTIHQICPHGDTFYIVMELVEGGALHEYLATRKRLAPADATRIVRAAAEGLGHAHKRGIIHRDIKPGNIMMTSDGQVKVSDFGLARDVLQGHDIVGAGHSLGTPRYMAPEQALGEEPTAASDLYSLAATYFVLLTGHAAFDGASDRDIMKKQVTAPVPDPRQYVPELPPAVFRFLEKAMAKEPEDRYITAEEFIEALDRLDFTSAAGAGPDSEALIDQLGAITAEDRGSHLTQALGRAVRRAQRQRTPMPEQVVENMIGASTVAARKSGWKIWLVIGIVLAVVIAGAVVAAVVLSKIRTGVTDAVGTIKKTIETTVPTTPGETPKTPGETPATPGETPATPGETPATPGETPATPAEKPKPPPGPLEGVADEVLKEVQTYEADPDTPRYEVIRMYQENVINVYPGTKAAAEAQKAIERLRKAAAPEVPPAGTPEKPPEAPADKPPEAPAEKPPDAPADKPPEAPAEKPPDAPAP